MQVEYDAPEAGGAALEGGVEEDEGFGREGQWWPVGARA